MDIIIKRQWNSFRKATTQLVYLKNLHWSYFSGGVGNRAPQQFVHANVNCTEIDGEIDHSCRHGPPPHSITVCIVKKDNTKAWQEIQKLAGPKPKKNLNCRIC